MRSLLLLVAGLLVSGCAGGSTIAPVQNSHNLRGSDAFTLTVINDENDNIGTSALPITATIATNCFDTPQPWAYTIPVGSRIAFQLNGEPGSGSCLPLGSSYGSITIYDPASQFTDVVQFTYFNNTLNSGPNYISINCGNYSGTGYVPAYTSFVYDYGRPTPGDPAAAGCDFN